MYYYYKKSELIFESLLPGLNRNLYEYVMLNFLMPVIPINEKKLFNQLFIR